MASSNISLDNSKLLSHHSGPMSPATSPVSHFQWPQMMPSAMVRWAQPEWFANFFFQGKWREWTWHEGIVSLKPTEVSECGRPGNRSIRSISKQWVYNYSKTGGLCHGVHPAFIGALFFMVSVRTFSSALLVQGSRFCTNWRVKSAPTYLFEPINIIKYL